MPKMSHKAYSYFLEIIMKNSCPDDQLLAAYAEGFLTGREKFRMETHLSVCDACLEEFMLTRSIVGEEAQFDPNAVPAVVTQSAVRLVNRLSPGPRRPLTERIKRFISILNAELLQYLRLVMRFQWRLSAVRGSRKAVSDDLFCIKKSFREFEAEIEIEDLGESMAHIRVRLLEHNGDGNGIRVTLKRGDRELCSSLFSSGRVLFEDISFGSCRLVFDRDGLILGTYLFDIKGARNGKK